MKLFYSPTSPYARKVRMVAIETGLAAQIDVISVNVAQEQPERFTQAVLAFLSEPMPAIKPHQQADSIADRLSSSQ